VAYVSAEVAAKESGSPFFEGVPILAVEILSPSDKQEGIDEKVALSLDFGVAIVWVVNPVFRTVCVYRPGEPPVRFNESQEIAAEPHLPGCRAEVAKFFWI
jgi:Uma2 family endonuclease